jgi:hypothetical protein
VDCPRIVNAQIQATAVGEQRRDDEPEHEATHVGEKGDAATVCTRAEQAEVRFEQLVEEPEAEEEPG